MLPTEIRQPICDILLMVNSNAGHLLTACEIFSCIELEMATFTHCILTVDPPGEQYQHNLYIAEK